MLLAVELLKEAKPYAEEGVHPQVIIRAYRNACELVCSYVRECEGRRSDIGLGKEQDQGAVCQH